MQTKALQQARSHPACPQVGSGDRASERLLRGRRDGLGSFPVLLYDFVK